MTFDSLPDIDIISFLRTLVAVIMAGTLLTILRGIKAIRDSRQMTYYKLRRTRLVYGWRVLFIGLILGGVGFLVSSFGEPLAYSLLPISPTVSPSPTIGPTPTITLIPSVTSSPTITITPAESYTPTPIPTPHLPIAVEAQFTSLITPPPEAVFSQITFSRDIDDSFNLIRPGQVFQNPVGHIYGSFSYAQMVDGVQWTALWYRGPELIYYETQIWKGGTGGLGFTDWEAEPELWTAGDYQVQIFIGKIPVQVGIFTVQGDISSSTPTSSVTPTPGAKATITPTPTRWPTLTRTQVTPSITPHPTKTRTITPTPTKTPTVTLTPTTWPTQTRTQVTPSITPKPTQTRTATPEP
ncbi:MAG: hypothetical protein N2D54_05840 [Chloroflexota bacterium]